MSDNKISIIIYPNTHLFQPSEHNDQALVVKEVHHNWMPESLAKDLQLKISPNKSELSEDWNGRTLQSIGAVKTSWSRNDVGTPNCFNNVVFHIATDSSFPVIIGNELLSKEKRILEPIAGVLPITSTQHPTLAEQAEIERRRQESRAKEEARASVQAAAIEQEKNKRGRQGSSSSGGQSSSGAHR